MLGAGFRVAASAALGLTLLTACASTPVADLVIRDVTVVDVESGALRPNRSIVIRGDRIAAVSRSAPRAKTTIDGTGRFAIPGLWDMHAHLTHRWERYGRLYIAHGVTGTRQMATWSTPPEIASLRQRLAGGTTVGPRFLTTRYLLDAYKQFPSVTKIVTTPEEARSAVDAEADDGFEFIKVYNSLSRETYLAILEQARRRNVAVAGHLPNLILASEASDLGQKSLEHLVGMMEACSSDADAQELRAAIREARVAERADEVRRISLELIDRAVETFDRARCVDLGRRFARNGTWSTPTLVQELWQRDPKGVLDDPRLRYVPPAVAAAWRRQIEGGLAGSEEQRSRWRAVRREIVAALREGGAAFLAGTDANDGLVGVYAGSSLHEELRLFVEFGFTPLEALRAATLNPARYFGRTSDFGVVERGRFADLVLLRANPLDDIRNAGAIDAVIAGGRHFTRSDLDRLLEEAAAASRESPQ